MQQRVCCCVRVMVYGDVGAFSTLNNKLREVRTIIYVYSIKEKILCEEHVVLIFKEQNRQSSRRQQSTRRFSNNRTLLLSSFCWIIEISFLCVNSSYYYID